MYLSRIVSYNYVWIQKKAAGVLRVWNTWTLRDNIHSLCVASLYLCGCYCSFTIFISYVFILASARMHTTDISFHFPTFYCEAFGELYFVKRFDENQSVIWLCGVVVGPSDIPCEPVKSLCCSMFKNVS